MGIISFSFKIGGLLLLRWRKWWVLPHFPDWDIDRGVGSSSPERKGKELEPMGIEEAWKRFGDYSDCCLCSRLHGSPVFDMPTGRKPALALRLRRYGRKSRHFQWKRLGNHSSASIKRNWFSISIEKMHARWRQTRMWQNKSISRNSPQIPMPEKHSRFINWVSPSLIISHVVWLPESVTTQQ